MSGSSTPSIVRSDGQGAPSGVASVTIVDDHLLFATALADLVRALPDFTVAGVAATGTEAIQAAKEYHPDLILLDFHLPGALATDILPDLREASPKSRIIILTSDTSGATREVSEAAGVDGFLTKEQALDDVAAALREALGLGARVAAAASSPASATPPRAAEVPEKPDKKETRNKERPARTTVPPVVTPVVAQPSLAASATAPAAPPKESPAAPTGDAPVVGSAPAAPRPEAPPPFAQAPAAPTRPVRGALIAVYGAKGGVGTTTVATNLGVALAGAGQATVLVDLDLGFGDVGVFLDLDGGPGIADAATGRISVAELSRTALQHSSGLRIVSTASTPLTTRPTPASVIASLEALRAHFQYVICDVPRVLGPLTAATLRAADSVVLVTTPELPALRDLERVLARGSLDLRPRSLLVVNRHPGRSGVALRDVEHGIGLPVGATIPGEGVAVTEAINRGVPLATGATRLGRAFRDLAERVRGAVAAQEPA